MAERFLTPRQRNMLEVVAAAAFKDVHAAVDKVEREFQQHHMSIPNLRDEGFIVNRLMHYVRIYDMEVKEAREASEARNKAEAADSQMRLRSHDNVPQRVANAMANLKAAAVNLKTAVSKDKEAKRIVVLLEKAYTNYSALADNLAEDGVLTLEDKAARDQEAWSVYEEALEANDQHLANKVQESHKEKLRALTEDLKGAKDMLLSKVQKLNNQIQEGNIMEDEDINNHVSLLEANLLDLSLTAKAVKEHAPYEVKAKELARATVDRAEGEVRGVITKMKKQLNTSNIYNSTMAPVAARGGMTASELGRAITKANQEEKAVSLIPDFDGDFKRYYKFRHEFKVHIGNRVDLTDEQKCSYLLSKLKGAAKREVENYNDLLDVWEGLDRRYDRPAVYSREVLKALVNFKPVSSTDMFSLHRLYGLILATRRELSQHGHKKEMETFTFIADLVAKLPLLERNEWVKFKKKETADEFFAFLKRRQAEVSELDLECVTGGSSGTSGGANRGSADSAGTGGSSGGHKQKNSQGGQSVGTHVKQAAANVTTGGQGTQDGRSSPSGINLNQKPNQKEF
jgi:Protein of unknown function (DUF1759)